MEMMTMLRPPWKDSLTWILSEEMSLQPGNQPRVAIVGIGNEFNGDDAAGILVARSLNSRECSSDASHVLVIEAGQAPENIAAELRQFRPQVVLLIDAAQVNAQPGEIVWIPWETTSGISASAHSLPLSMLARYLTLEFGCVVNLLGIQPAQNEAYTPVCPQVQDAIDEIARELGQALFVPANLGFAF